MLREIILIFAVVLLIATPTCRSDRVNVGSGVLDCVRFRSASQRKYVFGTGYYHNQDYYRFLAVYENNIIPHHSAFRIERINEYKEPLYNIKMINTREYVFAGFMSTATHMNRLPIFSYHHEVNKSRKDDGVWGFEKAYENRNWKGAWYIRNVYYNEYLIASTVDAEPPPMALNARFKALKLDRRRQVPLNSEHMFYIVEC